MIKSIKIKCVVIFLFTQVSLISQSSIPCIGDKLTQELEISNSVDAKVYFYNFMQNVEVGFKVKDLCIDKTDRFIILFENGKTINKVNEIDKNCTGDIISKLSHEEFEILRTTPIESIAIGDKHNFLLSDHQSNNISNILNCRTILKEDKQVKPVKSNIDHCFDSNGYTDLLQLNKKAIGFDKGNNIVALLKESVCIDEGDIIIINFKDKTQIQKMNLNKFNCKGTALYKLTDDDLKKMSSIKIESICVATYSAAKCSSLSDSQYLELQKTLNCLLNK